MQPKSRTLWIGLLISSAIAVAVAGVTLFHRNARRVASAQTSEPRTVSQTMPERSARALLQPVSEPTPPQPALLEPQSALPPPEPLTNAPDDPTAFALLAENDVSQLHDGIALAGWMNRRGAAEQWSAEKPEIQVDGPGEECLSMRKTNTLPSGAIVVQAFYFYPPPAPSPITFPTVDKSSPFNSCTLKIVRVEAEASAPEAGRAMFQALSQRLIKTYGDPKANRWTVDEAHWSGDIDIAANYNAKNGLDPNAPGQLIQGPVAMVFANLSDRDALSNLIRVDRGAEAAQFRRAVAAAKLDAVLSRRMENLYTLEVALADRLNQEAEEICKTRCVPEAMPKPSGDDWREPLVPLLQDWFQALKTAARGRHAAGLLAADRLLLAFQGVRPCDHFGTVQSSTPDQGKLRAELQSLGAQFATGFEDTNYGYAGNWLLQARDLDPDSEGGKLALLIWMSSGFSCAPYRTDSFREVISKGEAVLTKSLDAQTAAQVHFMVGDAYSDIVAIAAGRSGANGEYDPSQFQDEAETDRMKALAHYRAGLDIDKSSENAKNAWAQAWHLLAGLAPSERYVCFGD